MRERQGIVRQPSPLQRKVMGCGVSSREGLPATLLLFLLVLSCACGSLPGQGSLGGASPPPSGSLSVSFVDVGQCRTVAAPRLRTSHAAPVMSSQYRAGNPQTAMM